MNPATEQPHQVVFRATQFSEVFKDKCYSSYLCCSLIFLFESVLFMLCLSLIFFLLNLCYCVKSFAEIDSSLLVLMFFESIL